MLQLKINRNKKTGQMSVMLPKKGQDFLQAKDAKFIIMKDVTFIKNGKKG